MARDLGLSSTAMRQLVHRARVSVRAAATAVVPMPVATWLAAGAGGAGTAATLAKAGTLVVLAGGAVSAPALIEHGPPTPRHRAEARAAERPKARAEAAPAPAATVTASAVRLAVSATPERVVAAVPEPRRASRRADDESEHGDDRRGERDVREHADRGSGGGGDDDHSGSGGGDDDHSGPGGDDDHSGRQRPSTTPVPTPEAEDEPAAVEDGGYESSDDSGSGGSDESRESSGSGSGTGSSGGGDTSDD